MDRHFEEYTFLCSSQRIRRYGSLNDSSSYLRPKHNQIIVHKVTQADTLQSLELSYNSSMFEIKRLNKLWSDQSLYCKSEVLIPIYGDGGSPAISSCNEGIGTSNTMNTKNIDSATKRTDSDSESVDQLLKRIDSDLKKTKKAVRRLNRMQEPIKENEDDKCSK